MEIIGRRLDAGEKRLGIYPVEYNWKGDKLTIVRKGDLAWFKPMGPHSPARCIVDVLEVDEQEETITVRDHNSKEMRLTWDEWVWMQSEVINVEKYIEYTTIHPNFPSIINEYQLEKFLNYDLRPKFSPTVRSYGWW